MRIALIVAFVAACDFEAHRPAQPADAERDAPPDTTIDAPPIDARPDAPAQCPAAPAGCSSFSCSGSTSCYYVCFAMTSWTGGNTACMNRQLGCLATIDDAAENACVTSHTTYPAWIGFVQTNTTVEPAGGWTWACGSSTFTPSPPWGLPPPINEPNDTGGNEDCASIINALGHWNDAGCNANARYICELTL